MYTCNEELKRFIRDEESKDGKQLAKRLQCYIYIYIYIKVKALPYHCCCIIIATILCEFCLTFGWRRFYHYLCPNLVRLQEAASNVTDLSRTHTHDAFRKDKRAATMWP